ncbi:hypothetical protein I2I05_06280 [Hymenobacter sp. BT683]|uniref:LA2681-like HEPN domain-containing protein n=1 Tax=Hymenobacter jeongseonensis TaxID=2791027 RepID=A0ABS0IF74_9BACT|nr:hypothetical protein [Hymenobacter jeongseonensis]MBF9236998.1 hypothetical protein [Hymenobacter jeongseonensis]
MLYLDTLQKFAPYVERAVSALFDAAFDNQSHKGDLLIILENGFYQEIDVPGRNLSPYCIGPGSQYWDEQTQFEFYDSYRRNVVDRESAFKEHSAEEKEKHIKMSIHLELMVYLKFWESNRFSKMLLMLVKLANGENYDWNFDFNKVYGPNKITGKKERKGRSYILEDLIKDGSMEVCPEFSMLMQDCYADQIRNVVAHSQFSMSQSHIGFSNYEPGKSFHQLRSIPFEKWEEYITMVILFYDSIIGNINRYNNHYISLGEGEPFALPLRINRTDGSFYEELYAYTGVRWAWYSNVQGDFAE